LWAIRGYTRWYFGGRGDVPLAYEPPGYSRDYPTIFRPSAGLFAVRGITRFYFGAEGDIPIGEGYGPSPGSYDYIVRPGDAVDLLQALESDTFRSVFIPDGSYSISSVINVDHLLHIVGESKFSTLINFSGGAYLSIEENYCHIENLYLYNGGDASHGCLHIPGTDWVTVETAVLPDRARRADCGMRTAASISRYPIAMRWWRESASRASIPVAN